MTLTEMPHLNIRWLGAVDYEGALAIQRSLLKSRFEYLLLLEHPSVYTFGLRYRNKDIFENVLNKDTFRGVRQFKTDRGGDITFHGPGQLVGYPIINVGEGKTNVKRYVHELEDVLIDALRNIGITDPRRIDGLPGIFVLNDKGKMEKLVSIGIRSVGTKVMHGFSLNNTVDLTYFNSIVPCGIPDINVTSLKALGVNIELSDLLSNVIEAFTEGFSGRFKHFNLASVVDKLTTYQTVDDDIYSLEDWNSNHLQKLVTTEEKGSKDKDLQAQLNTSGNELPRSYLRLAKSKSDLSKAKPFAAIKPDYLKKRLVYGQDVISLKSKLAKLNLITVCQEASCPNISECWSNATATFMIGGDICTRACGFCDVKTGKPKSLDEHEPENVAKAISELDLKYAVVTSVDRDDLDDLGLNHWIKTIKAIRSFCPTTKIEVLIPDFKGDREIIDKLIGSFPDVLNHNMETVARLHRTVRPSAAYARSLALLAQGSQSGLITKSGLMVGLGETNEEVFQLISDLYSVGVSIVTIGQYLRPSKHHLPVMRYVSEKEFREFKRFGESIGIDHVESSPFTRSSFHADQSAKRYFETKVSELTLN